MATGARHGRSDVRKDSLSPPPAGTMLMGLLGTGAGAFDPAVLAHLIERPPPAGCLHAGIASFSYDFYGQRAPV